MFSKADPSDIHASFGEHDSYVRSIVELDNGRLVTADDTGNVHVWDPADLTRSTVTFNGHEDIVFKVTLLAEGRIASASADGTVQIWDPEDITAAPAIYRGHTSAVADVLQLGDGRLASASFDGTVKIWNADDPDTTEQTFSGHSHPVLALAQLSDGLVVSASTTQVLAWHVDDPGDLTQPPLATPNVVDLLELPDDRVVLVAVDELRVWDVNPDGGSLSVYPSTDGNFQAAYIGDGFVAVAGENFAVWDAANDAEFAEVHTP